MKLARTLVAGPLLFVLTACLPAAKATHPPEIIATATRAAVSQAAPTRQMLSTQTPAETATQQPDTPLPQPTQAPADCPDVCTYPLPDRLSRPADRIIVNSYPFGSTDGGTRDVHAGVEFDLANGSEVRAAGSGFVWWAGTDEERTFGHYPGEYGNLILIEHAGDSGEAIYSLYAHLSEILVSAGERVQSGQVIAKSGGTGAATGPHLHFEVRVESTGLEDARNPLLFIEPVNQAIHSSLVGSIIGADGLRVSGLALHLQRIPEDSEASGQQFSAVTYAPSAVSHSVWQENFVLEDLPPGNYRLSLVAEGRLYEQFFPIEPARLTYIQLRLGE